MIVPNPCRLLSRELLYTALTRQQREVVLFHQGDLRDLMKLSGADHSETARRLSNLFSAPKLVAYGGSFYESGLVHRTVRGKLVRSKSEVIFADMLACIIQLSRRGAEESRFKRDDFVRYSGGRRVSSSPTVRLRWDSILFVG